MKKRSVVSSTDKRVIDYLLRAETIAQGGGWLSSPRTSTSLIIRIAEMIQREEHSKGVTK